MGLSLHLAKPEHQVAHQELVQLLGRYTGKLDASELLAVAANLLGQLIALQDQRVMTREKAIAIVTANIEKGNQQVIDRLISSKGQA